MSCHLPSIMLLSTADKTLTKLVSVHQNPVKYKSSVELSCSLVIDAVIDRKHEGKRKHMLLPLSQGSVVLTLFLVLCYSLLFA